MVTKQELLDAVAATGARVTTVINTITTNLTAETTNLTAEITALQARLSAGSPVTDADLQELLTAINAIPTPAVVTTLPATAP